MLRDLGRKLPDDIAEVIATLIRVAPDVLLLGGIDADADGLTADAFARTLSAAGLDLPHRVAAMPNTGMRTGLDMNGDGRDWGPEDAQGYGAFPGSNGLLLLSRLPLGPVADYSDLLWAEAPDTDPPRTPAGGPFPSDAAFAVQRLPAVAHWIVPILGPDDARLWLTALGAAAPVFDGSEDRNGRRNADELTLVARHLDGWRRPGDPTPPDAPALVLGTLNLDPSDGQGRSRALTALLAHPRLQDPRPASPEGLIRARRDGGINRTHRGDPTRDTADFNEVRPDDPGNLRVDYVLPDRRLRVLATGLEWPATGRRAVVWVDLDWP